MKPIDPWTWLVARSGLCMVEAPRIDPRTLVTGTRDEKRLRLDPMQPLPGIVGERVAERPRSGAPHKASY